MNKPVQWRGHSAKPQNAAFREWLLQFTAQSGNAQEVDALMWWLRHVNAGRRFTRDEMNERQVLPRYQPIRLFLRPQFCRQERRAAQLIPQAVGTRKGIFSYQVVQEFFNLDLRRFAQPMTVAEAEHYLAAVFRPLLAVPSSPALTSEAFRLTARHRPSW